MNKLVVGTVIVVFVVAGLGGYFLLKPGAQVEKPSGGKYETLNLEDVEITYFSPIVIKGPGSIECGTDIIIRLKNRGEEEKTIAFTSREELRKQAPPTLTHFFSFHRETSDEAPFIIIPPRQEREAHWFMSEELYSEFTLSIDFWLKEDPAKRVTANIKVVPEPWSPELLPRTTSIYGVVTDNDGIPLPDVRVIVWLYNGREGFRAYKEFTDDQGGYEIPLPTVEDIRSLFGGRELLFSSLAFFITVEHDGYEFYYKDEIYPTKTPLGIDIVLRKAAKKPEYSLAWERQVDEPYGFFWARPTKDWNHILATQATHGITGTPPLNKPTHFYLFKNNGDIEWKYPVGNECWGADVTSDGSLAAVGCNDGSMLVVDENGSLKWEKKENVPDAPVRWVKFSHDGKYLVGGPVDGGADFALIEADSGKILWKHTATREWLRNAVFSHDDSRIIVGLSFGHLMAFDLGGNELWHFAVGEFPSFLGIDNENNVYTAGKGRTLFVLDEGGNLKWKYRVPDHVPGAGGAGKDGSRIVFGTVGGWVYFFSGDGRLLWRRPVAQFGDHALAITPDGRYVVAGTYATVENEFKNTVFLFDNNGTLLWKYRVEPKPIGENPLPGVIDVAISDDGSKILAAYGDSYIRMFERTG